jgi:hypothetical protein
MALSKEDFAALLTQMLTQEKYRDTFQSFMEELLDATFNKAAEDHTHEGGEPIIITRGTAAERNGSGVTVHRRTDVDLLELVVDGAVVAVVANEDQPSMIMDWQADLAAPVNNLMLGPWATFQFPAAVDTGVRFSFRVPNGAMDYGLRLEAAMTTADASKAVVFDLDYYVAGEGDDLDPASPTGSLTETISTPDAAAQRWTWTAANLIVPAGSLSDGDLVSCHLKRDTGDAGDTHGGALAVIHGWMIPS